nr:PEP-CTERM sorting domain-containing protein [Desulfobulbaceae bacterium]
MDLSITRIGVFDDDGDGLIGDLVWQLFEIDTSTLIHTQTVSATGLRTADTSIADNYVFTEASSLISLEAGKNYSVVAYGFDSSDKNFNTNFNLSLLDVGFNTFGLISGGGRYSSSTSSIMPTIGASTSVSTQAYNFGAATFDYDVAPVPEPATMLLFGTGLVGLAGSRLRRKKKA